MYADLDYAKAAGANVVRVDVGWATVESDGPGILTPWYSKRLDLFMAAARKRGLKVIALLFTTPCWASSAPDALKQNCQGDWWGRGVGWYPPSNVADYAKFVRFITASYGSELAAIEIWNEPDQPGGKGWRTATPVEDYARLLRAAYPAAKDGDSRVPVLAGVLAGSDVTFLNALYNAGIRGNYDGIAIHPYSDPRAPDASPPRADVRFLFAAGIAATHALQAHYGDKAPIWVTEFGWSTTGVTASQQASYVTSAYRILAQLSYVEAAVVYELHDDIGGGSQDANAHYGLLQADYRAKPAYAAFVRALTQPARGRDRNRRGRKCRRRLAGRHATCATTTPTRRKIHVKPPQSAPIIRHG
jgi:hypothetical protein